MSIPFSNTNYRIPQGFANLLEGLTREVLREQPKDIPQFAAKYFAGILKKREESGFDPAEWGAALQDRYYNNRSFQDAGDTTFTSHIGGVSDRGQSVSVSDRLVDLPSSVPEEEHKNDANEQRTEAATVIQAAFRGHLAREEVEKLRMQPGENLVSEEGSLFSLPEQSGVREKQSIESESPDLKATEPLSAIEEPESGQEQEPQTHEATEEPERRQEQEPQTHEATEELESGQEQEPQTHEATKERESGPEQEPQTHEAPEEPERGHEQEPQTHEATKEPESGQEQEPQTHEATEEPQSGQEEEPQTHEATEELESGQEQEPQTHEATEEPECGEEHEPQTHEATEEPQSGQEEEPQTHEATEEPESGHGQEPQTHEATEEPESVQEQKPNTHEATEEPESGQEQGPQTHEDTEEPENGQEQEPQTHKPHFTVDENEVTGIQYKETLLAEQPVLEDTSDRTAETMTVTIGDQPDSHHLEENEALRKQPEEALDIALDDPDANAAAAKIQAGFRGHMTRKKMKSGDKDLKHDKDDSAQGEHEGD